MINEVWKYLTVYFFSMVKFAGGPLTGYLSGLYLTETILLTVSGMMTTVFIITFLGRKIKSSLSPKRKKKLFTPRNRRIVSIWKKYGLSGIAFLTPIIFSPIIGTAVATAFGEKPKRIFFFMLFSAIFWSFTLSLLFFKVGHMAIFSRIVGP